MKILSLPVDRGGCGYLRVRQPFQMINRHTDSEAHVMDKDDDPVALVEALSLSDIVVVRQGGEVGRPSLEALVLKHTGKPMKAKWVLDIDDNVELISPYSAH